MQRFRESALRARRLHELSQVRVAPRQRQRRKYENPSIAEWASVIPDLRYIDFEETRREHIGEAGRFIEDRLKAGEHAFTSMNDIWAAYCDTGAASEDDKKARSNLVRRLTKTFGKQIWRRVENRRLRGYPLKIWGGTTNSPSFKHAREPSGWWVGTCPSCIKGWCRFDDCDGKNKSGEGCFHIDPYSPQHPDNPRYYRCSHLCGFENLLRAGGLWKSDTDDEWDEDD